jgi:arginyl-tRNA synthetase
MFCNKGDDEAIKLWTLFKDLSIKELAETYKKMNIKFDVYEAESQYFQLSKKIVQDLLNKNICQRL